MIIKRNVIMPDKLVMRKVIVQANDVWKTLKRELVITSGKEGTHSARSLHYYGYAVDFRSRFWRSKIQTEAAEELSRRLGPDYVVIDHKKFPVHIHVGYNKILKGTK